MLDLNSVSIETRDNFLNCPEPPKMIRVHQQEVRRETRLPSPYVKALDSNLEYKRRVRTNTDAWSTFTGKPIFLNAAVPIAGCMVPIR
ncbi:hypothetical protein NPIL_653371 [Nephila pilipes]|uniref:Uncharacterized protein n=1 Tax=Nephila pilipes TaxID=299642 RepID=A0A8X6P034_NEPPI|nr:hypothetical protein NPIL_653371 [Nephila pilipes]